jgi:hypothetical protein
MAKKDHIRIDAQYSNSIQLGGNNLISVDLCNIILSDFGQYTTVKLESEQLGTFLLDKMTNHTYQKEVLVSINTQNYPLIEGELCVYDGGLIIERFPISFQTTFDTIYNVSTSKTESRIEITVVASLGFASGEQPIYDGVMRAIVHKDGTYIDSILFASKGDLKSTTFTFVYRPVNFGNYSFEIYMKDPFHPKSQFVFETSYVYGTDEKPLEPIQVFENDVKLAFPLAIVILTIGSGGVVGSLKTPRKKIKDKLNKIKVK